VRHIAIVVAAAAAAVVAGALVVCVTRADGRARAVRRAPATGTIPGMDLRHELGEVRRIARAVGADLLFPREERHQGAQRRIVELVEQQRGDVLAALELLDDFCLERQILALAEAGEVDALAEQSLGLSPQEAAALAETLQWDAYLVGLESVADFMPKIEAAFRGPLPDEAPKLFAAECPRPDGQVRRAVKVLGRVEGQP